jgi:paraquat-inducible protein A
MSAAPVITGRSLGLTACRECGLPGPLPRAGAPRPRCRRCGAGLRAPGLRDLQTVWALLVAGLIAYVPANTYPMLVTRTLGREDASTIVGGAVELAQAGAWFVAAVVLVASVAIPVAKFLVIAALAWAIGRGAKGDGHRRHRLHWAVELVGRWSMIDVFVVAILAALVQLGFVAQIEPGPAAAPFAISVALTMLAAQALDPRLIWLDETQDNQAQ